MSDTLIEELKITNSSNFSDADKLQNINVDNGADCIGINEYTKQPKMAKDGKTTVYSPKGVLDIGNLLQFAPYETGYCFIVVLGQPYCMKISYEDKKVGLHDPTCYNYKLQRAFSNMIEREFKGLDGIEDITSDSAEVTNNIVTASYITKTSFPSTSQITMRFTEKSGSLITKYISTYLKMIRNPVSQTRTYNGAIDYNDAGKVEFVYPNPQLEVFNFLYIITDSTCMRVEKAFLLANMQPTTAAYSEVYNMEKGNIETREISIPFRGNVIDSKIANRMAKAYLEHLINTSTDVKKSKINVNSSQYNYSFADNLGDIRKIKKISGSYNHTMESIIKEQISPNNNNDNNNDTPSAGIKTISKLSGMTRIRKK